MPGPWRLRVTERKFALGTKIEGREGGGAGIVIDYFRNHEGSLLAKENKITNKHGYCYKYVFIIVEGSYKCRNSRSVHSL